MSIYDFLLQNWPIFECSFLLLKFSMANRKTENYKLYEIDTIVNLGGVYNVVC